MAKHKVFLGAMYSERYTEVDRCVMLLFPDGDKSCHEVVRPRMIEADSVHELREKLMLELETYLSNVYGFKRVGFSATPTAPAVMVEVDALTIEPDNKAAKPADDKNQMLLDLGSV